MKLERLLLAFPCEERVRFSSRRGTLNYFHGGTHKAVPRGELVLDTVRTRGVTLAYAPKRYLPKLLAGIGLPLEPLGQLPETPSA